MGTDIERLPSIAKLVFKCPNIPPTTKQPLPKSIQPRNITVRMIGKFLILPVTNVKSIVAEGETAFLERATRVALRRSEFESIRQQAKALRNDAVEALLCGEKLMHDAFVGSSRKNLDGKNECKRGCQGLVQATNTALEKQEQLCKLMNDLAALNKEHNLGVSIPPARSACKKTELRLVEFLGASVCVNK
jgi:hypothetical protein